MSLLNLTPLRSASTPPPSWTPADLTTKPAWFRSDSVLTSGSDVTQWTNLSTDYGTNIDMVFTSNYPQLVSAAINGQDALAYPANQNKNYTSPVSTAIVGVNQAFTFALVHKSPTLGTNEFYAILGMSANSTPENVAVFLTNLTGLPYYYIQIGNTPTTVVTASGFSPNTNWNSTIITYNGAGDYTNAANWAFYLNSVSQTVSITTLTGGSSSINFFGDNAGGGAPDAGESAEFFQATEQLTGANLTGAISYFTSRYGL